jgi:hypothetical protein
MDVRAVTLSKSVPAPRIFTTHSSDSAKETGLSENGPLPIVERAGLAQVLYTPTERNSNQNFLASVAHKGDAS